MRVFLLMYQIKINYFDNESAARRSICEQAMEYMTKAFMFLYFYKFIYVGIVPATRNVSICWETNFSDEKTY